MHRGRFASVFWEREVAWLASLLQTCCNMTETHHVEPEATADGAAELWQVRVSTTDVRVMTFEQLETAFREGVITENTFVMDEGNTEWRTLRQIAGREPVQADNAEADSVEAANVEDKNDE